MSDTPENESAAGVPSSAPSSPPASAPPVSTGGGDLDELPADQALFPRGYVEKLRGEAQKYRTEAQTAAQRVAEYDRVYADYGDEDRKAWFELAETWKVDPTAAAAWMQEVATKVLGEVADNATKSDRPDDDAVDLEGLTPQSVEKMIQDALIAHDQAARQDREVEKVWEEIRGHGIEDARDQLWVLSTSNEQNITLDEAVAQFRQHDQKVIDNYLAGHTGGNHPIPAPNGGVAANQSTEILSFEEARKATDAFLRAQGAAGT